MKFKQLTVIGVGLIGGSMALKLRELDLVEQVVGYGQRESNLQKAIELNVIDRYSLDLSEAVKGSDLILLAVPLAAIAPIYAKIHPYLDASAIVTDVGSAKSSVIAEIENALGFCPAQFVPGHPIAGREKSGVEAAEANLYLNHRVILTPLESTNPVAVERVAGLWQALGANVSTMTARQHDEIFAATSHLPHMLAFALVDMLNEHPELGNVFQYTAGGFRDFTRIASSDATMWRDIAMQNGDAIVKWIQAYQLELTKLTELIEQKKADALHQLFYQAKLARDTHILNKKL
jgi:prephenate dehydrogenase